MNSRQSTNNNTTTPDYANTEHTPQQRLQLSLVFKMLRETWF